LDKHSSKPYNPDIANALFRSGYIECWGRGSSKMTEQCFNFGLPAPLFFFKSSGFWVEFRKNIYNEVYLSEIEVNDRQKDALLFFKDKGEIVNAQYVKRYLVSDKTARRDLVELVEKNLLYRVGEGKGSKYKFR
jgi:ATP-dependent DNA helicase RecG